MIKVSRKDAEETLQKAALAETESGDKIALDDLVSAGEDVGLSKAVVLREYDRVGERKARRVRLLKGVGNFFKRILFWAIAIVGFALPITFAHNEYVASRVRSDYGHVEYLRSRVRTQIARQREVEARWASLPDGPERRAELEGSTNRVAVWQYRYDIAAARYNADSLTDDNPNGLPRRVPLAGEIVQW